MVATETDSALLESGSKTLRALQSYESTATDANSELSSLMENLVKQLEERGNAVKVFLLFFLSLSGISLSVIFFAPEFRW